jgi:hypothetical protein
MGTPEGGGSVLICSNSSTLRLFRHRALICLMAIDFAVPAGQDRAMRAFGVMSPFQHALSPDSEVGFQVSFHV